MTVAALLTEDAVHDRYNFFPDSVAQNSVWWYKLYHNAAYRTCLRAVVLLHLAVALFERPSSLHPDVETRLQNDTLATVIELCCILVYAADLEVSRRMLPRHVFWRRWCAARASPPPPPAAAHAPRPG